MRILRFDSVGGAGGNMILGALVDLGMELDALRAQLATLDIEGFELSASPMSTHGMRGTHVEVVPPADANLPHRHLGDIRELIAESGVSDGAKRLSTATFERLAEAEAHVHNATVEAVHFHEVGAIDSVVDIVGACVALDSLAVTGVRVGALPLGTGTTTFSHGVMPVPVPATVELLRSHPVVQTGESAELVTPTGAALLTTWAERLPTGEGMPLRIAASGNGFGTRELAGRANMLRAVMFEAIEESGAPESALVLECNLDDMVPELIGALTVRLLEGGALDVFTAPIQMKKQRPGVLLSVISKPADRDRLLDVLFTESTTFGVREYPVNRTVLARAHETVETAYGPVRVKIGTWRGSRVTVSPEFDDCVQRAAGRGVSVRAVYDAALRSVVS